MATLTTDIPVSTDLYTIDATSYDTFALTFVDGQVNRAQFPNVSVTFDFATISLPADLSQWVTVTITQPATGRVAVKWAGNVRVDPGVSISTAASTATTVYAFTSTGRDWTVFPSSISGVASDLSSQYAPLMTPSNERKREVPPVWTLANDGLGVLTSSGLTTTSSKIAASVGGTAGDAILPLWGPRKDWRISFKVTATKATASSKSYIGFTCSAAGVLPVAGTDYTFGIGYLAGSGIVCFKENVDAAAVLYADASITDGDVFDVELVSLRTQEIASGVTTPTLATTIRNAAGTIVYRGVRGTWSLLPVNLLIRTNVAAGALASVTIAQEPFGTVGLKEHIGVHNFPTGAAGAADSTAVRLPANPNGRIVYVLHGFGATPTVAVADALFQTTFAALTTAGYTVVIPAMGGDLWGNDTALDTIAALHSVLTSTYNLDKQACYLFGNSMGGGAACTLISNGTLPVKAAYLAQPAVDYETLSSNPSFSTSFTAAYPTATERQANAPLLRSASTYAGVPLMLVASASDTTISKTTNADALNTLVSGVTTVRRITSTGNHNDASHFRAGDMVQFFQAYQ